MLSVCIGVGCCLCPISSSEWRVGMDYLQFMYRAPSLSSTDEEMEFIIICSIVRMEILS